MHLLTERKILMITLIDKLKNVLGFTNNAKDSRCSLFSSQNIETENVDCFCMIFSMHLNTYLQLIQRKK